ncbi:MAG: 2-oxo acid dehydrogenase subunit E2 [Alphaproteobacteria bacterium]|jgi:2-oxoisovalerate dehydrogenase E2 component (dihydrolipoyl transacylase)|nr:2-oxo acid dehydrogenase subunit E2 [Alphaproteobacteria bacterium]
MSEYKLRMPDVGEGVVEAEIVEWHVKVGDTVEEDEDLLDVMTDKATVEIPSPVSGKVTEINGEAGDVIAVGTEILVIAVDGEIPDEAETPQPETKPAAEPEKAPEPEKAEPVAAPAPAPTPAPMPGGSGKALASPAVRARALELDIDLAAVPGSGPAGRVTREDLDDFVAAGGRIAQRAAPTAGAARDARTGIHEDQVIGLRRRIAQNMEAAWSIPMITYVEEVDVTELDALRKSLNADRTEGQPKLTLLPFLATAMARALPEVPQANAHYDAEAGTLTRFDAAHIGIATATEKGLMVPVLRHAEAMDVWQMAGEIGRLSQAAREGTAKREELSGSSITITSLGAMGGVVTTPLINVPETAIIGVNKIQERPVFDGAGRVVPRLFMNLSSSFDHRIVDGYDAARLIQRIRALMESPARLFM